MGKVLQKKENHHFKIALALEPENRNRRWFKKISKFQEIYIPFIEIGDVNMCRFHKMTDLFEMMPVQYVEFVIYGAIRTIKVKVSDYFEPSS